MTTWERSIHRGGLRRTAAACAVSALALAGAAGLLGGCHGKGGARLTPPENTLGTMYNVTYGKPFIDVDEMRVSPRPHRYIHGGFEGSHLRFSVYLPPKELYKGRFLLELEGGQGGLDKMMSVAHPFMTGQTGTWDWAYNLAFDDMGAYLVETNEGHWPDEGLGVDNPQAIWEASAYGTKYATLIAKAVYGTAPTHGYVNGCSGGGLRSSAHLQNAPDLFDGSVSQAWSSNVRAAWSIYGLSGALLGDKLAQVKDAADVGGGDIYAGLSAQQRDVLKTMYALGWPREAANQMKAGFAAAPFSIYNIIDDDPTYFTDFWTKPGYLGHDDPKSLQPLLVDTELTVNQLYTLRQLGSAGFTRASPDVATYGSDVGSVLDSKPGAKLSWSGDPQKLFMTKVTIETGPDAGKYMYLSTSRPDGTVMPFIARAPWGWDHVNAGDKVKVDNRDYIAYMYYYRYGLQGLATKLDIATPGHSLIFPAHRAMENPDGSPKYPQRTVPVGYHPGESLGNLDPKSKIIVLSGAADEPIWPTSMQIYEQMVRKRLGANADNQFRLWWLDHTPHCSGEMTGPRSTSLVPNNGVVAQAIRDVMHWAEDGVAPPPSVAYSFSPDNELVLPKEAAARKGIQPVADLTANGGLRAEVKVGQPVKFVASGAVPPGTGTLIAAQFDFDGQGNWPESVTAGLGSESISATTTHTYDKPGTYFAAFRVGSAPDKTKPNWIPIYNLARVRVVVR